MADKDPQLEFKKRARRRLVGAIALALLAAIVLPIVMDQEPQPINQDIQVRIPNRDTPFEGRAVPLPAEPSGGRSPSKAGPATTPPEPSPMSPEPRTEVRAGDLSEPAAEKPAEKSATKPHEKAAAAKPVAERKDAPPIADTARAQAILEAKDEYVVQLGVFSDPANVRKVQARVKAEGYNSFTEAIGGGKTRVRAGPFADRNAAEKARDRLKRGGLDGMVASKS